MLLTAMPPARNRGGVTATQTAVPPERNLSITHTLRLAQFKNSVREVLENALLGVQTDNYQLPLFTKDRKRVELLLNAATRSDASGEIVGVVGVGQDIVRRPVSIPRPLWGYGTGREGRGRRER